MPRARRFEGGACGAVERSSRSLTCALIDSGGSRGGRSRCAPSLVKLRPARRHKPVAYVEPDEGSLARLAREAMQDVTERRRRSPSSCG